MRRSLVLTSEFARHPFRRNLPMHVTTVRPDAPVPTPKTKKTEARSDLAFFLTSFVAGFVIIFGMIA